MSSKKFQSGRLWKSRLRGLRNCPCCVGKAPRVEVAHAPHMAMALGHVISARRLTGVGRRCLVGISLANDMIRRSYHTERTRSCHHMVTRPCDHMSPMITWPFGPHHGRQQISSSNLPLSESDWGKSNLRFGCWPAFSKPAGSSLFFGSQEGPTTLHSNIFSTFAFCMQVLLLINWPSKILAKIWAKISWPRSWPRIV